MASLTLQNLTKDFAPGVRAVDCLSLQVADGELMVLVGPSGCGKTTSLRIIAGLERPTVGTVEIDGQDVTARAPRRRDVAMVFQHSVLYPQWSVRANLAFGLKLRHLGRAEILRRVDEAAALLDIADLLHRRPLELSGGQRQRVALGRAIVRKPRLFLFDEPLSNLDAALRDQLRAEIRSLQARLQTTALYVTHDQHEAMTLGQRVAVMHAGRLQQVGHPLDLYRRPANQHVARLLGAPGINLVEGRLERRPQGLHFCCDGWSLPLGAGRQASLQDRAGRAIVLGLRPEHLRAMESADPATALPSVQVAIEAVESTGPDQYVTGRAGQARLAARVSPSVQLRPGEVRRFAVAVDEAVLFDPADGTAVG